MLTCILQASCFYFYLYDREERKKYYSHIKKSVSNPEKYLSIMIDGMDQGKSHLPYFVQKSKVGLHNQTRLSPDECGRLCLAYETIL